MTEDDDRWYCGTVYVGWDWIYVELKADNRLEAMAKLGRMFQPDVKIKYLGDMDRGKL